MRRIVLGLLVAAVLGVAPAAAASPTVRLQIIHVVHGCHVWANALGRSLGANKTIDVKRGTRLEIRVSCPMAFDVTQVAGPKLAGGLGRWDTGTSHTLVFAKRGIYKLRAVNVQSSEEMNLQTLGPDAKPLLTVRVR